MPKTGRTIQKTLLFGKKTWNSRAQHPLQTWEWGEFRAAMGIDVERIRWSGPKPAYGQLTFHQIPMTSWTIGYFPKGPPPSRSMIKAILKIGREKNAIFVQMEPNTTANVLRPDGGSNFKLLTPSHHPLFTKYTFVLDLMKPEEHLLKAMHSKTRYNLKVAQKHGVTVSEDNSVSAFRAYLRLNEETQARQGFYAHNKTYHQRMWEIMHKAGIAHLFTATYQGEVLAAWIIFAWDKILYYPYGASSPLHREVMAPTLLLWEIARWGKQRGYRAFDLWGALGPEPDFKNPWYGFHRFKKGFNPVLIEHTGSFDLILHPFLYTLYCIGNTIRWFLLQIIKTYKSH